MASQSQPEQTPSNAPVWKPLGQNFPKTHHFVLTQKVHASRLRASNDTPEVTCQQNVSLQSRAPPLLRGLFVRCVCGSMCVTIIDSKLRVEAYAQQLQTSRLYEQRVVVRFFFGSFCLGEDLTLSAAGGCRARRTGRCI